MLFWIAAAVLAAAMPAVYGAMPVFGDHPLPYGDMINRLGPLERHVSNMVSAVNFDFRGFDTLGEEIMLMTAVTGTAVLLRGSRGKGLGDKPATIPGRLIPPHSEALLIAGRLAVPHHPGVRHLCRAARDGDAGRRFPGWRDHRLGGVVAFSLRRICQLA